MIIIRLVLFINGSELIDKIFIHFNDLKSEINRKYIVVFIVLHCLLGGFVSVLVFMSKEFKQSENVSKIFRNAVNRRTTSQFFSNYF